MSGQTRPSYRPLTTMAKALGALALCYLVGRECGLGRGTALTGAIVLGLSPLFLFSSLQPLSDTAAATWTLAAMWGALRLHCTGRLGWAAVTGATFAVAVLVRPTNVVILPALLVLIGAGVAAAATQSAPFVLSCATFALFVGVAFPIV